MRNIRWQLLIAIGGFLLVIGYLFTQTPTIESREPQPVSGGVYREALVGSINRLNPILDQANQVDRDIDRLIYRGLIRFDSRGIIYPDLAEAWGVSADARLYTFTIRKDAKWHDGEPVVAGDVLYTFSKFQDADYPGREDLKAFWSEIKIKKLDDRTVQFQLPEPFAPFPDYLSVGLLPDHLLRGVSAGGLIDHRFNLQPVGTGPFRFQNFIMEEDQIVGVRLSAYEDFVGGRPFLDHFEFRLYEDDDAAFQAYLDEEVQGIGNVGPDILNRVLELPSLNLHTSRLPQIGMIFLNLNHPEKAVFGEKGFRQALLLALNRQYLINRAFQGQAVIAEGPILPGTWAFSESLSTIPYDPVRAGDLLDGLGWELPPGAAPGSQEYIRTKDEQILSLELAYPTTPPHPTIAEIIQGYWLAIGVQVELAPLPSETLLNDYLNPRDFEAALADLVLSPFPDPDPYPFWHDSQAETGQNYSGFTDRNSGIWLEKARTTPDLIERAELYKRFQHRFQDQLPALPLYSPVYNYAVNAAVGGINLGPLFDPSDRFANVNSWYLRGRQEPEFEPISSPTP